MENARNEFKAVSDRLDGLKSEAQQQIDELNDTNESVRVSNKITKLIRSCKFNIVFQYMNGLQEKEYQIVRSNNLDKEKAKLTAEFESEFNRVKVSCTNKC